MTDVNDSAWSRRVDISALARFIDSGDQRMWPFWATTFKHRGWIDEHDQLTEVGRLALITWKLTC